MLKIIGQKPQMNAVQICKTGEACLKKANVVWSVLSNFIQIQHRHGNSQIPVNRTVPAKSVKSVVDSRVRSIVIAMAQPVSWIPMGL